ncbi:hypothetical protein INT43_002824 [Umbelopsis isabellina]|uniref:C3H1-type domain-containing protein n=1 Tax=Mortierella isabellina TaxID=91625 RepID=A0A8H7Q5W6_MORIS|nr:hypothetical protein INT43_002824 [Umbelopsis isabellina]
MVNLDPPPDTTRLMSHLRRSQSHPDQQKSPTKGSNSSNLSHVPCKFWRQGTCTAGANCIFSHNLDATAESSVCKYFLKGNCKFGTKCALLHTLSPQAPDNRKLLNNRSALISRSLGTSNQNHLPSSLRCGPLDINGLSNNTRPSLESSSFSRLSVDSFTMTNSDQHSQLTANLHQDMFGTSAPSNMHNSHLRFGQSPSSSSFDGPMSPTETSFSPFSGRRGLFMPQHQTPQYSALSPRAASLSKLNGIPEKDHDYFDLDHIEDDMSQLIPDTGNTEESMLPSSLNDLLTPSELQSRRAREQREGLSNTPSGTALSRSLRSYSGSRDALPTSPISNGDHKSYRISGSPLAPSNSNNLGWNVPFYSNLSSNRGSPKSTPLDDSPQLLADGDLSSSVSSAINIPGGGGSQQHIASVHTNRRPAYSKGFDETDPFDPFTSGGDDDVQFYMEEDDATDNVVPGGSVMPSIQSRIASELRRPN